MIGYNVQKIEELMNAIAKSYETIGDKITDGWPELIKVMETEWVGHDQLSYEAQLGSDVASLYDDCKETVTHMVNTIKTLADDWRNFQKNNTLIGESRFSVEVTGDAYKELEVPALSTFAVAEIVKPTEKTFSVDTKMGLTSGLESAGKIRTQFDSYIDGVYAAVKQLYTDMEAVTKDAFLGASLSAMVNDFLTKLGNALAKLATSHKSIYEALDTLVANYQKQEEGLSGSVRDSVANSDFSTLNENSLGKDKTA